MLAPKPYRVLVTGSRTWEDEQPIRDAIASIVMLHGPENVVLVRGDAEGADDIAGRVVRPWAGVTLETHRPDWDTCAPDCRPTHRRTRTDGSTYCPAAALRRDAHMVDLGANECIAFIDPCQKRTCRRPKPHGSHGATFTADLAEKAGIPTRRWP